MPRKKKGLAHVIWLSISIIAVLGMVLFTIAPALVGGAIY